MLYFRYFRDKGSYLGPRAYYARMGGNISLSRSGTYCYVSKKRCYRTVFNDSYQIIAEKVHGLSMGRRHERRRIRARELERTVSRWQNHLENNQHGYGRENFFSTERNLLPVTIGYLCQALEAWPGVCRQVRSCAIAQWVYRMEEPPGGDLSVFPADRKIFEYFERVYGMFLETIE